MIDQIEVRLRASKKLIGVLIGAFEDSTRYLRVLMPLKRRAHPDVAAGVLTLNDIGAYDYRLQRMDFDHPDHPLNERSSVYFIEVGDEASEVAKAPEFISVDPAKPKGIPERMKHIGYWLAAPKEIGQGPNESGQFFYEYGDALSAAACASFPAPRIVPVFRYA